MERKNITKSQRSQYIKRIVKLTKFSGENGFKPIALDAWEAIEICKGRCGFYVRVDEKGKTLNKGGIIIGTNLYYEFELK